MCISTFFHLLGWELSNDKLVPYSECCKVLCVELTLTKTPAGCFEVRNTESRVLELRESMMQVLETNSLSRVEGERLRGRLQFASNQLFGGRFRNCLRELNFHVARGMKTDSAELAASLRLMCHLLVLNSPRSVSVAHVQWSYLFVDASFDPEVFSGIGGVLFDSSGTCTGCFSERDDTTLLQSLMKPEQQTAILELEGLAVAAALGVFQEKVRGTRLVIFTDNQSVQASLVTCKSANDSLDLIIRSICTFEEDLCTLAWIDRVPNYSNPADLLSREVCHSYRGVPWSKVCLMEVWRKCESESCSPSLHARGERDAVEQDS